MILVGIALLIYLTVDVPRRNVLKETLSVLTIISFIFLLNQLFLSRAYRVISKNSKMSSVVKVHKFIGYLFTGIILFHPFFIVFPRYFEGGIDPVNAFWTMITTFNNIGIILGIIAWLLLVVLVITSVLRQKLFSNYKTWRWVHGILSMIFVVLASFHMLELGRHSNMIMSIFIVSISAFGVALLLNTYYKNEFKKRVTKNEQIRKQYDGQKKIHNLSW